MSVASVLSLKVDFMDEAIKLLRQQVILCSRLTELLAELSRSLEDKSDSVQEVVLKIEPIIADLNKNSVRSREFLGKVGCSTFGDFIKQAQGTQQEVLSALLQKIVNLQGRLVQQLQLNGLLLDNALSFVNFNLNVLSQTQTQPAYGAELKTKTQSPRRLFDANI